MIGLPEILILLLIIFFVFRGYKRLPQIGRSSGKALRVGSEKASEFADRNAPKAKQLADRVGTKGTEVGTKVGDRIDPGDIGRRAGKGMREARDMRSSFKGLLDDPPPKKREAKPDPAPPEKPAAGAPAGEEAPGPAADAERRPDSDVSP